MALAGQLPLWNPYIFSGMPFFAAAQVGLLFPLNWLYLFFSPPLATNLMVLSTYVLAALGAFLYARRAGMSVLGAATTSLVWQWSGFMVGQITHINIAQTGAMLPWVLWTLESYAKGRGRKWIVYLSICVALQAFVGSQQMLAFSLLLTSAYALAMALAVPQARKRYLRALLFIAVGILLSAVQILPTFELLRNSVRADSSYDFFASFSQPVRFAETFFAPYVLGGGDGRLFRAPYISAPFYSEFIGYVGLLTIMLAVCAVVLKRDRQIRFWTAVAIICYLLSLGSHLPFNIYRIVYHVPIMNLFRVPGRHVMEVDFALAVLAGWGVTTLSALRDEKYTRRVIVITGAVVFLLTCLVVTVGRSGAFHLGREGPVSLLRAPELFLPIVVAGLSWWALWRFARELRGAGVLLFAILALDLMLWGQSSGWMDSPRPTDAVWQVPETVEALRSFAPQDRSSYRILTVPHAFDPAQPPIPPSVSHSTDWVMWVEPDIYMMHGIHNAAGYDGFGFARYSRLAGDMKVWGELTDPDSTLRGASRAMDILNVRYLLAMRKQSGSKKLPDLIMPNFPPATVTYGDFQFAANDLGVPNVDAMKRLHFKVPLVKVDQIALVTNLAWSEEVPDNTTVGRITLKDARGHAYEFELKAGSQTAEWAHDRPDIRERIKHSLPPVAATYQVSEAGVTYDAHSYLSSFSLPKPAEIVDGEIVLEPSVEWKDLLLSVFRISLVDSATHKAYPLRREWINVEGRSEPTTSAEPGINSQEPVISDRWKLRAQTPYVDIYENNHVLPRAWLTTDVRVLDEAATLDVIRTGKFREGATWDPRHTVLVSSAIDPAPDGPGSPSQTGQEGQAEIVTYEATRVELKSKADNRSILVLADNHYPGWRAYVDGQAVNVIRVDYNLRGVLVTPGTHVITFVYRPKSALIGLILSLLTLAGLLAWLRWNPAQGKEK